VRLSDLKPYPSYIEWDGEPVELKPFSLRSITWAERFFFRHGISGFERMNLILSNQEGQEVLFNTLIDIVYHLGESDFERLGIESAVDLKNKVAASAEKLEILKKFKDSVEQVILNSFPTSAKRPQFNGGKGFDEIGKGVKSRQSENWDQIYIEFFRTGGMTIDQFMDLTIKQIGPLMQEIQFKKTEELNILSDLIHKKIAIKKARRQLPQLDFTEDDVKTFEKMHKKLMEQSRIN